MSSLSILPPAGTYKYTTVSTSTDTDPPRLAKHTTISLHGGRRYVTFGGAKFTSNNDISSETVGELWITDSTYDSSNGTTTVRWISAATGVGAGTSPPPRARAAMLALTSDMFIMIGGFYASNNSHVARRDAYLCRINDYASDATTATVTWKKIAVGTEITLRKTDGAVQTDTPISYTDYAVPENVFITSTNSFFLPLGGTNANQLYLVTTLPNFSLCITRFYIPYAGETTIGIPALPVFAESNVFSTRSTHAKWPITEDQTVLAVAVAPGRAIGYTVPSRMSAVGLLEPTTWTFGMVAPTDWHPAAEGAFKAGFSPTWTQVNAGPRIPELRTGPSLVGSLVFPTEGIGQTPAVKTGFAVLFGGLVWDDTSVITAGMTPQAIQDLAQFSDTNVHLAAYSSNATQPVAWIPALTLDSMSDVVNPAAFSSAAFSASGIETSAEAIGGSFVFHGGVRATSSEASGAVVSFASQKRFFSNNFGGVINLPPVQTSTLTVDNEAEGVKKSGGSHSNTTVIALAVSLGALFLIMVVAGVSVGVWAYSKKSHRR